MGTSGLVIDRDELFWTNRGTPYSATGRILRMPTDGGPISVVDMTQRFPIEVAVDGSNVYWTNLEDGAVTALPEPAQGPRY